MRKNSPNKGRRFRLKLKSIGLCCVRGVCLIALAGCTVGPDFRRPETKLPAEWHGAGETASFREGVRKAPQPVEIADWWKNFDDPILSSLVERAILSNLDLRQAESRIRQARAARGVASAGLWPTVDTSASYRKSLGAATSISAIDNPLAAGTTSISASSSSVERNLFRAGLDATWELDFFGGTRRNIEAAGADLQSAVEDRRDVLITLVADVGTTYANLRQFQGQIEIARKNLAAQQHTAEITRKRHEAGFVGGLDVANAQAQAATTESLIPGLESSARAAIFNLSILLGLEPAALEQELAEQKPILPTPPEIPLGLPSDLLRRRPDIRRSEAQLHSATAKIGVATADLFPKFSLTGNFGFTGQDLTSFIKWGNRFWSWGPTVTWPIFDAGRIRWNIEIQNAVQEQTLLTYEKTILTALKDVETSLVAYAKELQHNRLLAEATANNRRAVDLSMLLYVNGKTDFLNVLNSQRALFATEDALAQSTNALITDLVALYKALGGGWENAGT
jgi:NodT family efflux transporter outer membrane factor (OMF) lipoprotein